MGQPHLHPSSAVRSSPLWARSHLTSYSHVALNPLCAPRCRVEERGGLIREHGCHGVGPQLQPFAVGPGVPRPPPAGPDHGDEGQQLHPRQLGVPAGKGHPSPNRPPAPHRTQQSTWGRLRASPFPTPAPAPHHTWGRASSTLVVQSLMSLAYRGITGALVHLCTGIGLQVVFQLRVRQCI